MRQVGITRRKLAIGALTVAAGAALFVACHHDASAPDGGLSTPTFFTSTVTDRRFRVADHMLASVEMQVSGEPFAQLLGRKLSGFDRFDAHTDQYADPKIGLQETDPLGYAAAVESYEYSKQPMNNLSFESGAGLALMFGPLQNPTAATGEAAYTLLRDRLQSFAQASHSGGPPGTNFVVSPAPSQNPLNVYGWAGYWPQFAELSDFDPAIAPSAGATRGCTVTGGYAAAAQGAQIVGDYECGYNSLNLPFRDAQVTKVIEPAALGFALWKQMLWVINYWQSLHDTAGNGITEVDDADLARVGTPDNTVVGRYPDPADPTGHRLLTGVPGTYLGDIPLEGWQGLTMLDEADNKAAFLLGRMTTVDGAALSGFDSTKAAIDYDWKAPLRWFPAAVSVMETADNHPPGTAVKIFPRPTGFAITDGRSRLRDLEALLAGFATWFALTDANNQDVGAQASCRATFDGSPFAADNGLPDGEESPHDRALAVLKVAIVDLDRMHYDVVHRVLVDAAEVKAGAPSRAPRVTTTDCAYAIVALRTSLRALTSTLALYSNDTPDTVGLPTALDGAKLEGASAPIANRMRDLIRAEADFLADHLLDETGAAANGFDLGTMARDAAPALVESQAAAIRGLLDAYLATSDERYRRRAIDAYAQLERRFWMEDVRAFRTTAGIDDTLTYTPLRLATLSGALRQYWKLVARRPGNERVASVLLDRWKRLNKLVVNGWDDANGDDRLAFPDECAGAGLQLGERALTGELGHPDDGADRDHDCVREIAAAKVPSALAAEVVFKRR